MQSRGKKYIKILLLSYLTVFGMALDRGVIKSSDAFAVTLLRAAGGFSLAQIFLFIGVCAFYAFALQYVKKVTWTLRDKVCVAIPAVLFAGFVVVGYSFEQTNSLDLVFKDGKQITKSLIAFVGYGIGFAICIACLYTWLTHLKLFDKERKAPGKGLWGRYKALLAQAPFRTTFLTLIILYIPYVILSYPAIFMGDTRRIIPQGFNFTDYTSRYLNLIDENVRLNGHHPVIYTLFVHACLVIGNAVFGSYNVGISLVGFTQLLAMCAVAGIMVRILAQTKVHENVLVGFIAYFAFAPRINNYMFVITKDIFAVCMMMMFLLTMFQMIRGITTGNRALIELSVFGIGMGLLRNDGKYIILGSVVIMLLLLKGHRKALLISGAAIAICLGLFFKVLMPAFHITPGSRREALSVPFQQTARYFRDYPEQVTEEEWEAVNAVLNAGALAEKYEPRKADNVKNTFRENATSEDLKSYIKVWFQMGLKHPKVYLQATLNNYFYYFYPGTTLAAQYSYSWSTQCMDEVNGYEDMSNLGSSFQYPEALNSARLTYERLRERFFETPVFSLMRNAAAYVWTLILLVFYLIKEKSWKGLALTIPLILSVGVCFISPCNGDYFRYMYGVYVCLPMVILQCLYICKCVKER